MIFVDEQIERVENRRLYELYQVDKSYVERSNKQGGINERQLWHGTTHEASENICLYGFNRSYCGRNGIIMLLLLQIESINLVSKLLA